MFKVWGSGLLALSLMLFASAGFAQDSCATDFNGDGVTDEADVEIFQGTLGKQAGDEGFVAAADLDGDGTVTSADYAIFLSCN
ncbi:MAG: hypothetical protein JRF61_23975 [Deltaproteobacteria bacterium]|jgi:hypothetical protein|nr:hypothetical protein [Deltaproteobacteria bacterium]